MSELLQIRHCTSLSHQQQTCQRWSSSGEWFLRYASYRQTLFKKMALCSQYHDLVKYIDRNIMPF